MPAHGLDGSWVTTAKYFFSTCCPFDQEFLFGKNPVSGKFELSRQTGIYYI
jgi:hypothetical protein